MTTLFDRAQEAADSIRKAISLPPTAAVILGSGLGTLADQLGDRSVVPYRTIPHFPTPTVAGHHGNLVVGSVADARVAMLQGRFHFYEGLALETVTFPIRVLQCLGVRSLILTAASGGIREGLEPGDIICLTDHLNLLGTNPLRGPNEDQLGPRFPDMTEVYSARLRKVASDAADRLGIPLGYGVYASVPGPSYETPAEIRMLRTLGADVVGMSTVPEAIVARHAGMEVLAFALVTNLAAGVTANPISHEEVLEAGRTATPVLSRLVQAILARIAEANSDSPT